MHFDIRATNTTTRQRVDLTLQARDLQSAYDTATSLGLDVHHVAPVQEASSPTEQADQPSPSGFKLTRTQWLLIAIVLAMVLLSVVIPILAIVWFMHGFQSNLDQAIKAEEAQQIAEQQRLRELQTAEYERLRALGFEVTEPTSE